MYSIWKQFEEKFVTYFHAMFLIPNFHGTSNILVKMEIK